MKQYYDILKNKYKIKALQIHRQKGGWASLAYKVITAEKPYFLKVYEKRRASTSKWTSLIDEYIPIVIWLNQNTGLSGKIIQPIVTIDGAYKSEDRDSIYMVFDYISGETLGEKPITLSQMIQLSEIISELHGYDEHIPVPTTKIKEDFSLPFCSMLQNFLSNDYIHCPSDMKQILAPYIMQISHLINHLGKLSSQLSSRELTYVLCHTDIHNWNLMQSSQLILIDWEGLKLAPPEADLFMLTEHPYWNTFLSTYQRLHKDFQMNNDVLEFYKRRRKAEDIWEWIEQLQHDDLQSHLREETLENLSHECLTME